MVSLIFFPLPQITRALVAARAFIQGLETGRDVVSETLKVRGGLSVGRAQGERCRSKRGPVRKSQVPAGEVRDLPISALRPQYPGKSRKEGLEVKSPLCHDP